MINLRGNAMIKWIHRIIDGRVCVEPKKVCEHCFREVLVSEFHWEGKCKPKPQVNYAHMMTVKGICHYCHKTEKEFGKYWCVNPVITSRSVEGIAGNPIYSFNCSGKAVITGYWTRKGWMSTEEFLKQNKESKMCREREPQGIRLDEIEARSKEAIHRLDNQGYINFDVNEIINKMQKEINALKEPKRVADVDAHFHHVILAIPDFVKSRSSIFQVALL